MAKFFYHVGYFTRSSFRAECNVVEESIKADLSIPLHSSRDDDLSKNKKTMLVGIVFKDYLLVISVIGSPTLPFGI